MKHPITAASLVSLTALAALVSGCATMDMPAPIVPAAIAVPAGNKVAMRAVGAGDLTYECKVKATDANAFEWVFTGPNAVLSDMNQKSIGKYYGGPTWESMDGSKVTGKQLAVSPSAAGNIPMQLVQANPAMGSGAMTGITYIQRVNTVGGVAPALPCDATKVGSKELVKYQADYVFYKAS